MKRILLFAILLVAVSIVYGETYHLRIHGVSNYSGLDTGSTSVTLTHSGNTYVYYPSQSTVTGYSGYIVWTINCNVTPADGHTVYGSATAKADIMSAPDSCTEAFSPSDTSPFWFPDLYIGTVPEPDPEPENQ